MRRAVTFVLGGVVGAAAMLAPRLAAHLRRDGGGGERAHATATFRFTADAPMERVAPLFGADRERVWAPDWSPRFVHPAPARDTDGMVFTVRHGHGDSVWVNTRFDLAAGVVQYVYVLPEVLATRITLQLKPAGARTDVEVTYDRTALSPAGDERVRHMSAADAQSGPEWAAQINGYLGNLASAP